MFRNKIEKSGKLQTSSVSKVIVFCVTPIVLENFMIVSSIKSMSWWMEKTATGREQQWNTCLIEPVNTKNIEKKHQKSINKQYQNVTAGRV